MPCMRDSFRAMDQRQWQTPVGNGPQAEPEILPPGRYAAGIMATGRADGHRCLTATAPPLGMAARPGDLYPDRHQHRRLSADGAARRLADRAHRRSARPLGGKRRPVRAGRSPVVASGDFDLRPLRHHPHRHKHVVPLQPGTSGRALDRRLRRRGRISSDGRGGQSAQRGAAPRRGQRGPHRGLWRHQRRAHRAPSLAWRAC